MRTAKIIGPDLRLEKLGISLVKVYERVGNHFGSVKWPKD